MMELQLTPEQNAWIQRQVDDGKFPSYSHAVAGLIDTAMSAETKSQDKDSEFYTQSVRILEEMLEDAKEDLYFWEGEKVSYEVSDEGSDEIYRQYYDALKRVSDLELEISNLKE